MSKQKYTIADVQQDKLLKLGLDLKDAFILSYLREMTQLKKIIKKTVDNKSFTWIDYEKLMNYLPVLKINTVDAMYRRFKRYEDTGLVLKHIHKAMQGSYTFFHFEEKFFDLFEITKISSSDEEIKEQLDEMGLTPKSDEKSGGTGWKVGSTSDEKSGLNTPINNTPIKDKSSSMPAAPSEEFEKELKKLLPNFSIQHLNKNSVKNIKKYSRGDISQVEEVLKFMHLKNKSMTPDILVAILRDGDHTKPESIKPKEIKRNDKIKIMSEKLGEKEIKRLRNLVINDIGFEGEYVERELGNVLCKKYNELMREGSLNVS